MALMGEQTKLYERDLAHADNIIEQQTLALMDRNKAIGDRLQEEVPRLMKMQQPLPNRTIDPVWRSHGLPFPLFGGPAVT